MKEIQEKRIENELSLLKNSLINIKKVNKEEYFIDVTLPHKIVESQSVTTDINFLIHMVANFPFNQPRVYCKTPFCFPHISDGRDLLEDIIGQNWTPSFKIIDVVNKLTEFVKEFTRNLEEGLLVLVGNFYLGEKYDLALLNSLPIYVKKAKEIILIDNKEKEISKILLVSDIFFCLFDQEKWTKNNLHLTFWSNIRSLVTIKKLIKGDVCRFFWKQKCKKKNYEMILSVENSNELVNLMLDKMSKFGINYKISKHNLGPKQGVIPSIDIETVENSIEEFERKLEMNPDMELMQYLMSLYEKAVEYYSATNNLKWEYYRQKIHETLKNPRINEFLNNDTTINSQDLNCKEQSDIPKNLAITHVVEEKDVMNYNYSEKINPHINKSEIEFDKNFKNEIQEKELKLEITQDENEKIEYSDEEEEDEEEDV